MIVRDISETLADEKTFFDENGYLIVRDLLDADELAELRRRVDLALNDVQPRSGDEHIQWEPGFEQREDMPRAQRIRVLFHLCHRDAFFWAHATRPAIVDRVVNLLGPDIKLYTDQMFVKNPYHGTAVPWHQDSAYWPLAPSHIVSCWVAIDDATIENGCVRVLPGTHRRAISHHGFSEGPQALGLLGDQVDAANEMPIVLKAGSCLFHHSLLVHRSEPNLSGKPRRGLVSIYCSARIRQTAPWPSSYRYGFSLIRGQEHPGCI